MEIDHYNGEYTQSKICGLVNQLIRRAVKSEDIYTILQKQEQKNTR